MRNGNCRPRAWIGVSGPALCCLVANLGLSGQALAGPCTLKRLATVDLTIRDGIPTVPVIINGHPAAMEVNTSRAVGELSSRYLTVFGLGRQDLGLCTETETDKAGQEPSHFRAMSLTGEGIAVRNAEIELRSHTLPPQCGLTLHGPDDAAYRSNCEGGEAPLTLGMDIARRLHFYFATKEGVLYVSEADPTK